MTTSMPLQLSTQMLRDLYTKMLLTRIVDRAVSQLSTQGHIDEVVSCCGYEAAQIGSASCIQIGTDFTLPYYRDLGVVLTIGMTPYEIFRSCLQSHRALHPTRQTPDHTLSASFATTTSPQYWGYHKHNTVTGSVPVATSLLHAAGIAFASKLRKARVVTVAYCDETISNEADFHEALAFADQQQLPVIFICEHHCNQVQKDTSCFPHNSLPAGIAYERIDGQNIITTTLTMQQVMERIRAGGGPTFIEMNIQLLPVEQDAHTILPSALHIDAPSDPLRQCQLHLQAQGDWDEAWAQQLTHHLTNEVADAMHNALRDTYGSSDPPA
jgi:2-oxoisovalerate dehydrogenase E1 component alpha subunit